MGGGTKVVDAPPTAPSGTGRSGAEIAASRVSPAADKGQVRQERRRNKRVNMKLSARVRPFDLTTGDWNEVLVTLNASRQSIYFTTSHDNYHVGMRLRVTFPFTSVHDSAAALEDNGEVMRTERLPGNLLGVAVQMWGAAIQGRTAPKSRPTSADGTAAERRVATRRPFSAEATVFDSDASVRLQARCSDLSLEGCYVDTLNPFPVGTISHLQLHTTQGTFEAIARVNSSHPGMGMGLCFQDLTPEQIDVLVHWLGDKPAPRLSMSAPALAEPAKHEDSDAMEKALAINLVRHMLAKGILSKADITDIFFNPGII
jgi:hypothetical protein